VDNGWFSLADRSTFTLAAMTTATTHMAQMHTNMAKKRVG